MNPALDSRARFEAHRLEETGRTPRTWGAGTFSGDEVPARLQGKYVEPIEQAAWEAWQAAIASSDARIAELETALSIGFSHMMLAPIDGTPVLLYMPTTDEKFAVGQWHGSPNSIIGNWGDDEGNYYVHQPVGWIRIGALEKLVIASKLPSAPPIAADAAKETT